jgi:hypothetical protein
MRQGTNTEATRAMTARFGFALLEAISDSNFLYMLGCILEGAIRVSGYGTMGICMLHRRGIAWAGGVSQLLLFGYSVMVNARDGQGGEDYGR